MTILFKDLGLSVSLLNALKAIGYEEPTQVQQKSIPYLLSGQDLLSQAQTGTGKTAAFALPILQAVDVKTVSPQALVITPTRELALQVAEAFQSYAKHIDGFHVMPIYGGQDYRSQLRLLKRGVHVVVGTPGRVMDHMRRGSLEFSSLRTVVLDEADEMLRMGFVEDVEWILDQIEHEHQTALFSATMPEQIKRIAARFLHDPEEVFIVPTLNKVDLISQHYLQLPQREKLDILTRFLEVKQSQATLIFVRTRNASTELAEKLQARGYSAAALNGDLNQSAREKVISRIKKADLDIIVATDVAARGIDVERVNLVVNYDIPYDVESYIHRIGRTGRAGRKGEALLFVTPRERRLYKLIQSAMGDSLKSIEPPSREELIRKRDEKMHADVVRVLRYPKKLNAYRKLLDEITQQEEIGADDVALALLHLIKRDHPLPVDRLPAETKKRDNFSSKPRSSSRASSRRSQPFQGEEEAPEKKSTRQRKSTSGGRGQRGKRSAERSQATGAGRSKSGKRSAGRSKPAGAGRSKPAGAGRSKSGKRTAKRKSAPCSKSSRGHKKDRRK